MNSNNHNPHRRNSSNFSRHNNNHSNRSNHNMNHPHNHQKWPNRYPKEYNREYENNFNRRECLVASNGSPKEPNHVHGFPKNPQLSPSSRNSHTHYNNEAPGHQNPPRRPAHQPPGQPERRQQQQAPPPPLASIYRPAPPDLRRRPSLGDRRHASPPLRVNVCENAGGGMGGLAQAEGGHQRGMMDFSHGRRRNGIDVRVSPVHFHPQQQQHSPPFYRHQLPLQPPLPPLQQPPPSNEEYVKSESPSCKRRRLSRSGRHAETAAQAPSPAAGQQGPPQMQPPPRRSPRQHQSAASHPQMHHQVPVPIPVAPDAVWSYTASPPHLSLCTAPPSAPPHLRNCHLHNMYAAAAAPLVTPPQQQFAPPPGCLAAPPGCLAAPPPHHHQGFAAFGAGGAGALSVSAGHYGHQRMTAQRADPFDLDLLNDPHRPPPHPHHAPHPHHHHPPTHHPHHAHPAAAALHHVPPAAAAASLFLATAETLAAAAAASAATPIELLHAARQRHHHGHAPSPRGNAHHHHHAHAHAQHHHRLGGATGQQVVPPPTSAASRRWHHSPPLIAAPTGFLLHFFTMFSNSPMSPFSQASSDSNETTENYEALLNLAEQLGEVIPRGLSKLEIEQLVSYKYDERTHEGDQTSCVVCMCDFEARQAIRVLPCAHEFHAKCIDKWLRSNRTCPICRGNASDFFTNNE